MNTNKTTTLLNRARAISLPDLERRKDEIEYFGLFANPSVYADIKGIKTGSSSGSLFTVDRDDAEYVRLLDAAAGNEPDVRPRRERMKEKVAEMRAKMAASGIELPWERLRREHGVEDPWTAPEFDGEDPGTYPRQDAELDTLIVEEPDGKKVR